jgi:hypothetical protein
MDSNQKKIHDFHPWSVESNLNNQFILFLDKNSFSGEFLIHEMIIKLLKNGEKVFLICINHNRNHYESVLRKYVRIMYMDKYISVDIWIYILICIYIYYMCMYVWMSMNIYVYIYRYMYIYAYIYITYIYILYIYIQIHICIDINLGK